jgi:hypothetical protein
MCQAETSLVKVALRGAKTHRGLRWLSPQQQINQIDQEIDAVRRDLRQREVVDAMSAESWHRAWSRHSELQRCERILFHMRGLAQLKRDEAAQQQAMKAARAVRLRKCPTCKQHTLAAQAAS